ncbi:hypothetical protein, partial [Kitasatospora sp. LaBMicrA B282]|uniref:hypothetical protein n=1 Tax=Kitasatospora sp. LaBMicrA B282 TaxID=3420949 RepID=UPI003D0C867A
MTEDRFARRTPQAGPPPGAGSAPPSVRPEPSEAEEQVVRDLLHRAVEGVHPDAGALPRIRRAIPRRRARNRQLWTGAVLIVMVSVAAVPTLRGLGGLQLSDGSASSPDAAPGSTGSSTPAPSAHPTGGRPVVPLPVPSTAGGAVDGSPSGSATPVSSSPTAATTLPAAPGASPAAPPTVPDCGRADLGGGQGTAGAADGNGWYYGSFTVTNVSGHACELNGGGAVTATLGGGTGVVRVLAHTAGDPAGGLPDPAGLPGRLLLAPGGGYRLPFAFQPDTACPAGGAGGSGGTPVASPSPSAAAPAASGAATPT